MIASAVAGFVASGTSCASQTRKGRDVRLVRVGRERIAEEDHRHDLPLDDAAADDQVAPFGTVSYPLDLDLKRLRQQLPGRAGGDQPMPAEQSSQRPTKANRSAFFWS